MKFVAALSALISTAVAIDAAALSALLGDLQQHSDEYLSYIGAHPLAYPKSLMAIVQEATASSVTDLASYTSNFPTAELSSFLSGFPGKTRVNSEISSAEAAATGASSVASSTLASSTKAASTAAAAGGASNSTGGAASNSTGGAASNSTGGAASNSTGGAASNSTGGAASNTTGGGSSSSGSSSGASKNAQLILLPAALISALAFAL